MELAADFDPPADPTVSVVIPAYNAAPFLAGTLKSVLAQTYRDFELIVVDDGSEDETAEVVSPFGEAVRYIYKPNGGSASARNRGIREARGRYVSFLDADDRWLPEKLAAQMAALEEQPDRAWCYTDLLMVSAESEEPVYRMSQLRTHPQGDVLVPLLLGNFITPSSALVRRDVFREVGCFDDSPLHRISEDWELWLRIAARYPVAYVPEPLVLLLHHAERKTETMDLDEAMRSRRAIIDKAVARNPDRLSQHQAQARANLHVNTGRKWLDREERSQARTHFLQALRLAPTDLEAWQYALASLLPRSVLKVVGRLRRQLRRAGLKEADKRLFS